MSEFVAADGAGPSIDSAMRTLMRATDANGFQSVEVKSGIDAEAALHSRSPKRRPKLISIASNGGMRTLAEVSSGPSAVNTERYPPASKA